VLIDLFLLNLFLCRRLNFQAGVDFIVCDAGGSTVDTTLYSVTSARPVLELEEKRASACESHVVNLQPDLIVVPGRCTGGSDFY
jgi:hypothetical protein